VGLRVVAARTPLCVDRTVAASAQAVRAQGLGASGDDGARDVIPAGRRARDGPGSDGATIAHRGQRCAGHEPYAVSDRALIDVEHRLVDIEIRWRSRRPGAEPS